MWAPRLRALSRTKAQPPIRESGRGIYKWFSNESGSIVDANTEEVERTANMMRVDGFDEHEIADAVAFQRLKFHYARTGQGWDDYAAA